MRSRRGSYSNQDGCHPRSGFGRIGEVPDRLSDTDVLAAVLSTGGQTARATAERLVNRHGLGVLRDARVDDLAEASGIEKTDAERILASVELGRRVYGVGEAGPSFESPEAVYLFNRDLARESREHFAVLLLNSRNRIVDRSIVSVGSLNASIVHPREVFRPAIEMTAAAMVLVHNHPSGDPMPSRDDIEIARRLIRGGELLGIQVLDHVIVARDSYLSMRRERILWT